MAKGHSRAKLLPSWKPGRRRGIEGVRKGKQEEEEGERKRKERGEGNKGKGIGEGRGRERRGREESFWWAP